MTDISVEIRHMPDGMWRWGLRADGELVALSTGRWDRRQGAEADADRLLSKMHWMRA